MAGLVFSGCVATTTDVDRLQDSLDSVQKSQADLVVKLDELQTTLEALNAGLESNQNKMGDLSVKLDDTQTGLVSRMDLISRLLSEATHYAAVAVPGDFYRAAYGDYLAGKIDLALSGFEGFLERYPDSDLADDAQFYLADCRLLKKDFIRARAEFDKVLRAPPAGPTQARRRARRFETTLRPEGHSRDPDQGIPRFSRGGPGPADPRGVEAEAQASQKIPSIQRTIPKRTIQTRIAR